MTVSLSNETIWEGEEDQTEGRQTISVHKVQRLLLKFNSNFIQSMQISKFPCELLKNLLLTFLSALKRDKYVTVNRKSGRPNFPIA